MEFSCEYTFEELEIEKDGVFFGCFRGKAELAHDTGYGHFWVKAISLDGQKETSRPSAMRPWRKEREQADLCLPRPMYGRKECFEHFLFDAIETALYRDENAKEFFAGQFAEIAA